MSLPPDTSNKAFSLAAEFVKNTSRHLFLTGKAGTGKTTFLKHITATATKKTVVAAPTGVAAINAGGVTLHSLFQLPFGPFIPSNNRGFSDSNLVDKSSLIQKCRIGGVKRELIQEMELLIIDEVSMLRADTLDAIDTLLRSIRKNLHAPFGGVQVLLIGDLYQLPPVILPEEWEHLKDFYDGPFFFQSQVIKQEPPLFIELKKIYRQKEQLFIDLLNNIRNNQLKDEDWVLLNSRYNSKRIDALDKNTITLTSHNKKADAINQSGLENLTGKTFVYKGQIEKEFNTFALPSEMELVLKEGARVMFIKNDSGEDRKYYNGKLATVSRLTINEIHVIPDGEKEELTVEKETWKNIRYVFNKEEDKVEEEELGSYKQYPLRLAWAITIHKSQGLTFEELVIDAGSSFTPGQVYVALSRCTSLEGLTLLSKIQPHVIQTNHEIQRFAKTEDELLKLEARLEREKKNFSHLQALRLFDWNTLTKSLYKFKEELGKKALIEKKELMELSNNLIQRCLEQKEVAEKFNEQLKKLLLQMEDDSSSEMAVERLNKAVTWFSHKLFDELIYPLNNMHHRINAFPKKAKILSLINDCLDSCWMKLNQLQQASFPEFGYVGLNPIYTREHFSKDKADVTKETKVKRVKGETYRESLKLLNAGHNVEEIATIRNLSPVTIQGHFATMIETGDLHINRILGSEKIIELEKILLENPEKSISLLVEESNYSLSYHELKQVFKQLVFDKKISL